MNGWDEEDIRAAVAGVPKYLNGREITEESRRDIAESVLAGITANPKKLPQSILMPTPTEWAIAGLVVSGVEKAHLFPSMGLQESVMLRFIVLCALSGNRQAMRESWLPPLFLYLLEMKEGLRSNRHPPVDWAAKLTGILNDIQAGKDVCP